MSNLSRTFFVFFKFFFSAVALPAKAVHQATFEYYHKQSILSRSFSRFPDLFLTLFSSFRCPPDSFDILPRLPSFVNYYFNYFSDLSLSLYVFVTFPLFSFPLAFPEQMWYPSTIFNKEGLSMATVYYIGDSTVTFNRISTFPHLRWYQRLFEPRKIIQINNTSLKT